MRGSSRRLATVRGDAMLENKRSSSSCTINVLLGERLGLPSPLMLAAKHKIVRRTKLRMSASSFALASFPFHRLPDRNLRPNICNAIVQNRNMVRKNATRDRLGRFAYVDFGRARGVACRCGWCVGLAPFNRTATYRASRGPARFASF